MARSTIRLFVLLALLASLTIGEARAAGPSGSDLKSIKLPPGFTITIFADDVPGARSMARGPKGTIFVGTRRTNGRVYAVTDKDGDGRAEEVLTVASGLDMPNGVAVRDGALYVAEVSRVLRFDDIENNLRSVPEPVVVQDGFPSDEAHGWKYIAFGPDGRLYAPVGFPCNVCETKDERYGSMMRMNADGSGLEIYARGIRNTVGFDFHPRTGELWFTNNGRDWLGDNQPPDTLHHAPKQGMHFGFPYCNAGRPDPDYGAGKDCSRYARPDLELGPHVAALGMKFYTGSMFPEGYRGAAFIAEHGSWNRSTPIGYRISLVRFRDGRPVSYEAFAEGWLKGRTAWGRPVDVLVMPDGALLVSDDKAGAIYRIAYKGQTAQ